MDKDNKKPASKEPNRGNAKWSCEVEAILIQALLKAKEERKWGDNNPKPVAWTACVAALSGSEKTNGGVPKNAKAIKSRWQRVCAYQILHCTLTCLFVVETRIRSSQGHA
jgi:hypothetical protein